jgi:small conductance mechanosensitive channel
MANLETDLNVLSSDIWQQSVHCGLILIKAVVFFLVGRLLIGVVNKVVRRLMDRRNVEPSVKSFTASLINVLMIILLIISVIGALGVETTSFAALLASAGVAVGMALSGNLSNFAGGLIILLFKPFRIGDVISAQGQDGTVREIQIFHTVIITGDGRKVFIPNGALSSGSVVNCNVPQRRVEWTVGVDYGSEYVKVRDIIEGILSADKRILSDPAPFIALRELADSSVNIIIRAWVNAPEYWDVYYDVNQKIYDTFNARGIDFPFPQLTVHNA